MTLRERQAQMLRKNVARPERGHRVIGQSRVPDDAPALTMSTIKFYLLRLLLQGHSPAACAWAFRRVFGELVLEDAIRSWKATAFTDPDELSG